VINTFLRRLSINTSIYRLSKPFFPCGYAFKLSTSRNQYFEHTPASVKTPSTHTKLLEQKTALISTQIRRSLLKDG